MLQKKSLTQPTPPPVPSSPVGGETGQETRQALVPAQAALDGRGDVALGLPLGLRSARAGPIDWGEGRRPLWRFGGGGDGGWGIPAPHAGGGIPTHPRPWNQWPLGPEGLKQPFPCVRYCPALLTGREGSFTINKNMGRQMDWCYCVVRFVAFRES